MDLLQQAQVLIEHPTTQVILHKADDLFPSDREEAHDYVLDHLTLLFELEFSDEDWPVVYEHLSALIFKLL